MIVIDEAHHALAKTYKEMWERFPKAKFPGTDGYTLPIER